MVRTCQRKYKRGRVEEKDDGRRKRGRKGRGGKGETDPLPMRNSRLKYHTLFFFD